MKEINYKYISCPINLMKMMDSNCRNLLVVLLMIEFEERNNTFKVNSKVLQTLTGYSKKVLNATLSSLHRNGIITVKCSGTGKGKKQSPNTITINYDKFKEYDEQFITLTKLMDETQHIVIDEDYWEKGYKVSYLPTDEVPETNNSKTDNDIYPIIPVPVISQSELEIVPPAAPATENDKDIDTPAEKGISAAYPFLDKEEIETNDVSKSNNTLRYNANMKKFNIEEILKYVKQNNLSIFSNGIPSANYFKLANKKTFDIIENQYGTIENTKMEELWKHCVINGINI